MHFLYIDPGTGMILIQLIVAGFASLIVFFKNFRDKIVGGNLLTDTTKRAFLATAAKMYVDQLNNYNRQYETERKIALDLFGEDQVKNAIPKIDFDIKLMDQLKNMETIDAFLLKDNTDVGNFEEN